MWTWLVDLKREDWQTSRFLGWRSGVELSSSFNGSFLLECDAAQIEIEMEIERMVPGQSINH